MYVVYRPPPSKRNVFFDQWAAYLNIMLDTHDIIICSDLNFHLHIPTKPNAFSETFADCGIFNDAMHIMGHTLDVFIVRDSRTFQPYVRSDEMLAAMSDDVECCGVPVTYFAPVK